MGANHSKNHDGEDHVCPVHDMSENASSPLFGSTSFYDFNRILSGSCAAFACAVIFFHIFRFATHLSNPGEQVKTMRVALLIPLYSLISFLSISFPEAKVYLHPWLDVFQAQALASFFLLLCEFVSPSHDQRDIFFAALTVRDKKAPEGRPVGVAWYRKRWILIFQYPVVALGAAVATDITAATGVFCEYETKYYFAKLWIDIIRYTSIALAVFGVVSMAVVLRPHLTNQKPVSKLVAFKLIVTLAFLQQIIFRILDAAHALEPTSTLTYADLHVGIPSMLSCIEMVPICLLLVHAYPLGPYILHRGSVEAGDGRPAGYPRSYQGGPLGVRAFLAMLNPAENIEGFMFAFRMAAERKRRARDVGLGEYNRLVESEAVQR